MVSLSRVKFHAVVLFVQLITVVVVSTLAEIHKIKEGDHVTQRDLCHVTLNKCSDDVSIPNVFYMPKNLRARLSQEKFEFLNHLCYANSSSSYNGSQSGIFKFNVKSHPFGTKCMRNRKQVYLLDMLNESESEIHESQNKSFESGATSQEIQMQGEGSHSQDNYFTPRGFFKAGQIYVNPDNFCISGVSNENTTLEISICSSFSDTSDSDHNNTILIPKCCPLGSIIKLDLEIGDSLGCAEVKSVEEWEPYFYKEISGKLQKSARIIRADYEHKVLNNCDNGFEIQTPMLSARGPNQAQIRLTEIGEVYTRSSGNTKWEKLALDSFCIDGLLELNTATEFERTEEHQILIHCALPTGDHTRNLSFVYFVMLILSSVFLCAIVVIYALIWEKQNIHGWTIVTFSFSMLAFLICQAMHHGTGLFQGNSGTIQVDSVPCFVIGLFVHFFYIATFSWMTVVNFDLWSTIISMTSNRGSGREEDKKRFKLYALFGYGIPTIVIFISLLIEFNFGIFDDRVVRPQYGRLKCDLDKSAYIYHAVIVNTILFCLNIILGALTVNFLWNYRTQSKKLRQNQRARGTDSSKLEVLFAKLFVLMGFTWIFELAGWVLADEPTWYVVIFDMYNLLQSILLFWIFVCKKEIKDQLRIKYGVFEGTFSWIEEKLQTRSEVSMSTYTKGTPSDA